MSPQSRVAAVLAFFPFFCWPALSEELLVKNNSNSTIYHLYAWPSDLLPGTSNLLPFPLREQDVVSVDIDNSFDDCKFTFMIDINNVRPSPQDGSLTKPLKKPANFEDHNICLEKKPIFLLGGLNRE